MTRRSPAPPRRAAPGIALALASLAAAACGDAGADASAGSEGALTGATTTALTDATTTIADPSTTGDATATATGPTTSATGSPDEPAPYTFFTPLTSRSTYLIDGDGALVHAWESDTLPAVSAFLLPGGDLLRTGVAGTKFNFAGAGGRIERRTWEGALLWTYDYSDDTHRQHHDVEPLPDGHLLIVAWEHRSADEAIAAGRDPAIVDKIRGLWPDTIVELDPESMAIVWEWRVWDHLVQDFAAGAPGFGDPALHPELVDLNHVDPAIPILADWNHFNGVDYNPELDQIVISSLAFSELWIIDHATTTAEAAGHVGGARGRGGDLLYRWGNPAAYRSGDAGDRQLFHQHDPRWVRPGSPGAGDLTIFNNGEDGSRPWSTVVEITPPLAPDGTYTLTGATYGPAAPVWEYVADPPTRFYSQIVGGAQRLKDGNTLINEGTVGRAFEVTPAGAIVREYVYGAGVFRFDRFDADDPALAGRDLTPIGPPPAP